MVIMEPKLGGGGGEDSPEVAPGPDTASAASGAPVKIIGSARLRRSKARRGPVSALGFRIEGHELA